MQPIIRTLVFFSILIGLLPMCLLAQNGEVTGQVVDKLSQTPIAQASIIAQGTPLGISSDSLGRFRLLRLQPGTYQIIVSCVGYKNYTISNVVIGSGNVQEYKIEMEPADEMLPTALVKANRRSSRAASLETPLSVQRLTAEEIRANPGGNFDISKVVQTLPGVGGGSQSLGFRNDIIIRGGAPNEQVFYLDGIEIPVINHFQTQGSSGGPQGMLNVSFIEEVKLSTSAFDARYDNALSGVFQFKQKSGNLSRLQGNIRLSATELAATFDGPLRKNGKTSFLASARRSYLQFLFSALDLPIRPNFWDFQTKITHAINEKTTISFLGLAAIDEFAFAVPKNASPEKYYILNSNPMIQQWNYTLGFTLRRLVKHGYLNLALSRNEFENQLEQYEDNEAKNPAQKTLDYLSNETENKIRLDWNKNKAGWKWSYGMMLQWVDYDNKTTAVVQKSFLDQNGQVVQPAIFVNFTSPLNGFLKYGFFAQAGKRLFDNKLGLNMGLRNDMNSFTTGGRKFFATLSPRFSASWAFNKRFAYNLSAGRYFKIPPYTILGFADDQNNFLNKAADYQQCDHITTGFEYVASDALRITIEAFYKTYQRVPLSLRTGISLANLGGDFQVLGNEAVVTRGSGQTSGLEFFVQKKLTNRFFGLMSATLYRSRYTGINNQLVPSSWDNRVLLSTVLGYKCVRNWELGIKFRYQGGAPYTPFDEQASRLNYLTTGRGVLDYSRLNQLRLAPFHGADLRVTKRWNFSKMSLDLFLDVTNFYAAKSPAPDYYTFARTSDQKTFATTNGLPLEQNGSNAIPLFLKNNDATITPSLGFILAF